MLNKSLRDILGVFSSNTFTTLVSLLAGIIISRILGPEGRGLFSSLLIIPVTLVTILDLGIKQSTVYHYGTKKYSETNIFSAILFLYTFTSLIGLFITSIAIKELVGNEINNQLYTLVILILPIRLALNYYSGIKIGKSEFKNFNRIKWVPAILNFVGLIIFLFLLQLDVRGAFIALLVSELPVFVFIVFQFYKYFKKHTFKPDTDLVKSMISKGIIYALALFVIQLNYKIDILFLTELSTLEEVGYYSLAISIVEQIWQIPSAIGIVIMSNSAQRGFDQNYDLTIAKILRITFLIALIGCAVVYVISPYIIPLIYGDNFFNSVQIIRTILPGILFFVIFKVINSRLAGLGLPQIALLIFVPTLLINVILNIWWIPIYGGNGAAMASNVSYILGAIALLIVYVKRFQLRWNHILKYRLSDFAVFKDLLNKFNFLGK